MDYTKIYSLEINAEDEIWKVKFKDFVIDLRMDTAVSGSLTIEGKEYIVGFDDPPKEAIAKVVDNGTYKLLDQWGDPLYQREGYVPAILDYYNTDYGFGDYITLQFIDGWRLHTMKNSSPFLMMNPTSWVRCEPNEIYTEGYRDGYDQALLQIAEIVKTVNDIELKQVLTDFINENNEFN